VATENRIVNSGNRIEIQLDGKKVGLINSYSANDEYGHEPASGIGDIHAQEYVPGMARHQITVDTMVLFTKNLRDLGVAMENGDEVLKGLVFDIVVYGTDPLNSGMLRKYKSCSYTGGDVRITKHAIVTSNAQFVALDVSGKRI
jgi:hypothetical protein